MLSIAPANIVFELICFTAFVVICGGLMKPRFSGKVSLLIAVGCLTVVAGIQMVILFVLNGSLALALTLLPVTTYLPVIITVHVLSKNGFATAVVTWSFGVLAPYILNLFRDLLQKLLAKNDSLPFDSLWFIVLSSLVLAAFFVFMVLRFCRKPFQEFVFRNKYVWIIVPVILALSLASYVENINFNPILSGILFLSLLVMFLFVAKFLNIAMSEQTLRASERAIATQLELQREEIVRIRQNVEQGRIYRHDMRHHLLILEELAERENADGVRQYIGDLNNQISSVEKEDYCENVTVNAVLTAYIGRAKQQDIKVAVKARIPQELPINEIDICTILANALNNAIVACCANESARWIELSTALHDNDSFSIDIRNACDNPVEFGKDGIPVSHRGEGHGFGLKSINTVVQKHNGMLRCTCDNQVFRFSAVLFKPDNKYSGIKRAVSNTTVTFLLILCFINIFPNTMQALDNVPVIGNVLRLAGFRTYHSSFNWGSSSFEASFPQIEWKESISVNDGFLDGTSKNSEEVAENDTVGIAETDSSGNNNSRIPTTSSDSERSEGTSSDSQNYVATVTQPTNTGSTKVKTKLTKTVTTSPSKLTVPEVNNLILSLGISNGVEDMNQQMEEYIQAVKEEFLWYFLQKYQGYVASDTDYTILRNDDRLLSIRFYTTLNVGGSGEYSRCFTLDKTTGKVLTLSDLFTVGSDYIGVISADILRQMTEEVESGKGDYFIPGGIWSLEECFKEIDADQNFYVDKADKLVIIFDEYEVAPGSMGMPQFTVETTVLDDILRQPSILSKNGKETG